MKTVCIDFETANSKRSSACALGIAVIEGKEIIETREWLIHPHKGHGYFHPRNVEIHGITWLDVKDAPEFDAVFAELAPKLEGAVVVAHNAPFDMSVLRSLVELYQLSCPKFDTLCTCMLSRRLWPALENHRLDTLCEHIGHRFEHHQAGSDAEAAANVLLAMMREANTTSPHMLAIHVGVSQGVLLACSR